MVWAESSITMEIWGATAVARRGFNGVRYLILGETPYPIHEGNDLDESVFCIYRRWNQLHTGLSVAL